ncbi:hypothetical protein ACHAPE_008828 [Trichoderma viride]
MSFFPTQIFAEGTTEEKGENARLSAFVGAIAVGDLVKSTLGPKGMDKILQSASTGDIMVTNDGATILKSIALDNAAAKVLVNISKVQDDEVGDGTTSVAVLAAELLREAEKLVDKKIHPQTIIEGYRIASQAALKALEESAVDHSKSPEAFRKDLVAIARTTLSSKVLSQDRDQFSQLAVDAILRLKKSSDLSHIQIIKKAGGKLSDSYLDEGFILDKKIGVNQPKRLEKAKILVANTSMDTDKVKIFGARVKVASTGKLAELEKAEKEKMKAKVDKIKAHGINCFINRQLIYNWPEQLFTDAGIMSIEHADFDGIERLALVTGGEITSTFDHPDQVKLGHCDLIEEVIIGEDTLIKFSGVAAGEACTIVLRGATQQLLDEAERSLHDALAVLSQTVIEPRTTLGGGCAEMLMAKAVEGAGTRVEGKKQVAVSSFATALRQLPTILADNAGLDSGELVARLRKAIYDGLTTYGLDLMTPGGGIADMREVGVIESYKLKKAVVSSASEAAELLLRVDDIIRAAPRRRERILRATTVDMAEATHDVISISSSDDDSDCQIVKVSSSLGGRIKSKTRWQYQPYKLPRPRRSKNIPRQLHEDADDDLQDKEPISNENTQSFEASVTAGGDAARNGCSQSMDQSIDPLRFGLADLSSINEMSDAKTERSVTTRVDPTDPLANRHHTADLEPSMLPPPFPSQMPDPSNQISTLDNEGQRESRSRSCSVATLDFPLERADAQRGDVQGLEGDAQGIDSDMLDEQRQLLLGGPTILADCANHPQIIANPAVLPNEDGYQLALGSAPESERDAIKTGESDQAAIKTEEIQDVDTGSLQRFKRASTTSRGRLPRVGKRRAWRSIINFAGYETLLGPLFTQQKEMIRSVTYDDMVEERAEMKK